jgi:hypothetical protein
MRHMVRMQHVHWQQRRAHCSRQRIAHVDVQKRTSENARRKSTCSAWSALYATTWPQGRPLLPPPPSSESEPTRSTTECRAAFRSGKRGPSAARATISYASMTIGVHERARCASTCAPTRSTSARRAAIKTTKRGPLAARV